MHNKLLYSNEITVPLIMKKVSEAMEVDMSSMTTPDKQTKIREREKVSARQISMTLSKKHTRLSLEQIGMYHGGRDHTTVLHAVKAIGNLIDTRDQLITSVFFKVDDMLMEMKKKTIDPYTFKVFYNHQDLIKSFIRARVDLITRQTILNDLNNYSYDRYTMAALSNRVQKGHKRKL